MTERSYLSIREVLDLLVAEFPDITISKIRFLESRGLIHPERTPSGYRKFYDDDDERLRWILGQQRENFLPLKVIKRRLEASSGAELAPGIVEASLFEGGVEPYREPSTDASRLVGVAVAVGASPARDAGEPAGPAGLRLMRAGGAPPVAEGPERAAPDERDRRAAAGSAVASPVEVSGGGAVVPASPAPRAGVRPEADGHGAYAARPHERAPGARDEGVVPGGRPGGHTVGHGEAAVVFGYAEGLATDAVGRSAGPSAGGGDRTSGRSGPGRDRAPGSSPAEGDRAARPGTPASGAGRVQAASPPEDVAGRVAGAAPATSGSSPADRPSRARDADAPAESGQAAPAAREPASGDDAGTGAHAPRTGADVATAGGPGSALLGAYASGASFTADELASAAGVGADVVAELEEYGLVAGRTIAGVRCYDEEALVVARLAAGFRAYGIESRHLRAFKSAAERQAGLYAQVVTPYLRQRNPASRERAHASLAELAGLGAALQSALVRAELRDLTGG